MQRLRPQGFDFLSFICGVRWEAVARACQLVEGTKGSIRTEGLEYSIGRDQRGAIRRGIARAPALARHATDQLTKEVEIAKQRQKFREEQAAQLGDTTTRRARTREKTRTRTRTPSSG